MINVSRYTIQRALASLYDMHSPALSHHAALIIRANLRVALTKKISDNI